MIQISCERLEYLAGESGRSPAGFNGQLPVDQDIDAGSGYRIAHRIHGYRAQYLRSY
jgi:hypothetical protein